MDINRETAGQVRSDGQLTVERSEVTSLLLRHVSRSQDRPRQGSCLSVCQQGKPSKEDSANLTSSDSPQYQNNSELKDIV